MSLQRIYHLLLCDGLATSDIRKPKMVVTALFQKVRGELAEPDH